MAVVLLLLMGLPVDVDFGDSCEAALHKLRQAGLQIEATNVVEDEEKEVLVYTMTERKFLHFGRGQKKTVILGCAFGEGGNEGSHAGGQPTSP